MNVSVTTTVSKNHIIEINRNVNNSSNHGENNLVTTLTEQEDALRKQMVDVQTDRFQTTEYKKSEVSLLKDQIQKLEDQIQKATKQTEISQSADQSGETKKLLQDEAQKAKKNDDSLTRLLNDGQGVSAKNTANDVRQEQKGQAAAAKTQIDIQV